MRALVPVAVRDGDRVAIAPAGFETLFALARINHGVDQPDPAADHKDRGAQQKDIGRAAVALVLFVVRRLLWFRCHRASGMVKELDDALAPVGVQAGHLRHATMQTSTAAPSVQSMMARNALSRASRLAAAHASGMRVSPIKLAGLAVERARLQRALVDAVYRHDLGIIARGENFVGVF